MDGRGTVSMDAEVAQVMTVGCPERRTGIGANMRVVQAPGYFRRSAQHQHLLREYDERAKRQLACSLAHIHAKTGFEPLPIRVHQRPKGKGRGKERSRLLDVPTLSVLSSRTTDWLTPSALAV